MDWKTILRRIRIVIEREYGDVERATAYQQLIGMEREDLLVVKRIAEKLLSKNMTHGMRTKLNDLLGNIDVHIKILEEIERTEL